MPAVTKIRDTIQHYEQHKFLIGGRAEALAESPINLR